MKILKALWAELVDTVRILQASWTVLMAILIFTAVLSFATGNIAVGVLVLCAAYLGCIGKTGSYRAYRRGYSFGWHDRDADLPYDDS